MNTSIVVLILVPAMLLVGAVPANAGFAASKAVAVPEFDRDADLEKVRSVLEARVVRQRLADVGYSPAEIEERLDSLSDHQLHRLATDLDEVRTGKGAIGAVIGVLLVVLLVVVIVNLVD